VLLGVAGLGLIGYGAYGLVTAPGTDPGPQALAMLAFVLGHDLVLIPVATVGGLLALRVAPPWARAPAQAALLVTLALTVVAVPFLVKAGSFPENPSLLPLDYRRGLLIAAGVTWLVAAGVALGIRHRSRRRADARTDEA
jgi:hypothetical protein